MLTKTLLSVLPLLTLSLATPTHLKNRQVATTSDATATIISYFVATACNSPFSQATQTLTSNTCMDLGEGDTTRSIALYDVLVGGSNTTSSQTVCTVQVFEDEQCTSQYNEIQTMQVGTSQADQTCFDEPSWGDGSTTMGSVMLSCET